MKKQEICYNGTRGGRTDFSGALLSGAAPDGGLWLPERIPKMAGATGDAGRPAKARIADVASAVLSGFLPNEDWLVTACQASFSFPVPLTPLRGSLTGVHILELFHGPTGSFKDFGARFLAHALHRTLDPKKERRVVLVATSGDTGSAVADACARMDCLQTVVLYPLRGVGAVQEAQLTRYRPGVTVLGVDGSFDDCQRLVRQAFQEPWSEGLLTSANSINVGRLLPQTAYYVFASMCVMEPALYVVPSGNLGNLTAGIIAAIGGMPATGFVAAQNANDWFVRRLGGADPGESAVIQTMSNAMDVGVPSNYERIAALLDSHRLAAMVSGTAVNDAETRETIRLVFEESGYQVDPHTAVGVRAAQQALEDRARPGPIIVLGTAHPAKYPELIQAATGRPAHVPRSLQRAWHGAHRLRVIPARLSALRTAADL